MWVTAECPYTLNFTLYFKSPLPMGGSGPPSTWFLGPIWVLNQSSILIGSAIFVFLWQTDHATQSVTMGHTAELQCGLKTRQNQTDIHKYTLLLTAHLNSIANCSIWYHYFCHTCTVRLRFILKNTIWIFGPRNIPIHKIQILCNNYKQLWSVTKILQLAQAFWSYQHSNAVALLHELCHITTIFWSQ